MEKSIIDEIKVQKLKEYYDGDLTILGLNDSQGLNVTSSFVKKGLLDYIVNNLKKGGLSPDLIDAFSLFINKTEHIDYLLENNLNLEEIKLSQTYGFSSALEKVMTEAGLYNFFKEISNNYKLDLKQKPGDSKIFIANTIKEVKEPVVIYSSGFSNLMRDIGVNPLVIDKDYKARTKKPNFNYSLEKANDSDILRNVIYGIERNFENIFTLNKKADIYAFGSYVSSTTDKKDKYIFEDLIRGYNEELEKLCKGYNISFINTDCLVKQLSDSKNNLSSMPIIFNMLANKVIDVLYDKKIGNGIKQKSQNILSFEVTNNGPRGVVEAMMKDYSRSIENAKCLDGYEKQRELAIAQEHLRELKVFQKVLKNYGKN